MTDEIIAALPSGRSHYDLAALMPGLNGIQFGRVGWQDVGGTNNLQIAAMSIHGGSFLDTKMAINGLSSRNLLSSSWASNFIADTGTAAEWAISYAGQGAEANSSGVTFNMIPKDGGNRFSGAVFATGANEDFQSSNYTPELPGEGPEGSRRVVPDVRHQPFGRRSHLSNRLWFYGSGRWQTNQFYIPGSVGNANAGDPSHVVLGSGPERARQVQYDTEQRKHPSDLPGDSAEQVLVLSRATVAALDRCTRGDVTRVVHRLPVPHQPVYDCRMDVPTLQSLAGRSEVGRSR